MTPIREAIEKAQALGMFAPILDALLAGHVPTAEERQTIASLPIGDQRWDALAWAFIWYGELKTKNQIKSVARRVALIMDRFNLTEEAVHYYVVQQKEPRVTERAAVLVKLPGLNSSGDLAGEIRRFAGKISAPVRCSE